MTNQDIIKMWDEYQFDLQAPKKPVVHNDSWQLIVDTFTKKFDPLTATKQEQIDHDEIEEIMKQSEYDIERCKRSIVFTRTLFDCYIHPELDTDEKQIDHIKKYGSYCILDIGKPSEIVQIESMRMSIEEDGYINNVEFIAKMTDGAMKYALDNQPYAIRYFRNKPSLEVMKYALEIDPSNICHFKQSWINKIKKMKLNKELKIK